MFEIIVARSAMGHSPVSAEYPCRLLLLVNDRVDTECGRYERSNTLALFMHCIAVERSCVYARSPTASLEIQREHVRGFDRLCRCKARANRFATARESCEVVKRNTAGHKHT